MSNTTFWHKMGKLITGDPKPRPEPVQKPAAGSVTAATAILEQPADVAPAVVPEEAPRTHINSAKAVFKQPNARVCDDVKGLIFEYVNDDDEETRKKLGRKRRYKKNIYQSGMYYFLKRDRAGKLEPIVPPEVPGEITPEQAGDALNDPVSAQIFANPTSWLDVLKDFKYPIIIGILVLAIFILAFTFNDPQRAGDITPIPAITTR